jgi:hypothetical protein
MGSLRACRAITTLEKHTCQGEATLYCQNTLFKNVFIPLRGKAILRLFENGSVPRYSYRASVAATK